MGLKGRPTDTDLLPQNCRAVFRYLDLRSRGLDIEQPSHVVGGPDLRRMSVCPVGCAHHRSPASAAGAVVDHDSMVAVTGPIDPGVSRNILAIVEIEWET